MSEPQSFIDIKGLTKAYGYLPVLKKLDLTIERGDFVALLGPNGSGKSTLMRLLAGLSKPTSGTLHIGGWSLPKEASAVHAHIGVVGHQSLLYGALSARENLRYFARLYNIKNANTRIDELLDQVGLSKRADSPIRTYSRGMQQRCSIARALLHEPSLLLFDEPYTGLDQTAGALLDEVLRTAAGSDKTIIMATHQLERASQLAHRVVILTGGKVGYDAAIGGASLSKTYADVTGMTAIR